MSKKAKAVPAKKKPAVPSPKPTAKKPAAKLVKPSPVKAVKKTVSNPKPKAVKKKPAVPSHAEGKLPKNPVIGEGRLWDGKKWIKVAVSALGEIVVWQNHGIKRSNSALKYLGDATNEVAKELMAQTANPALVALGQRLQDSRQATSEILDGIRHHA